MIKRIEGGVTYKPQVYDVQNRLVSVTKVGTGATTFTYDANGIRVKTVHPGGKTSYFPFPGYEEEVNGSTITRRVTYAIAGQTVALRVQVVGGSNTLYYLHSDHLGSTSLATTTSGAVVAGSTARYLPFGGWRTMPTANLTDIGFTGHRHNNLSGSDLGLVYMNARFYVPGIGRFASADTLVPDPANPQQFNRYSYVLNNPLRYPDPTGRMCYDHTTGPELLGTCVNEDGSTYSIIPATTTGPTLPPSTPLPTNLPTQPDTPLNEANRNAFNWASQSLQWLQGQGYSLEQAIAFLLFKEVSIAFDGRNIAPVILDAITHKYNQYCSAGAGTAMCIRGFWSYYQPMLNLWNSSLLQGDRLGGIRWFFNDYAANVAYLRGARQVISRPELDGQANHRPSGWASVGSTQNRATYLLLESVMIGPAQTQVFYKADSGFYDSQSWLFVVLSVDQQNYHCGGSCVTAP